MDNLDVDLITRILSAGEYSPAEICQLSTLNTVWKEACHSPCLWEKLELEVPKYTESGLEAIAKHCGSLKELFIGKDPRHPRALTLHFCAVWIESLGAILSASSRSLRKLVVAPGCNMYRKDYRSSPFYRQLMRKVAKHSRKLKECHIYYNSGRCGMEREIPKWFNAFARSCSELTSFTFFTPGRDFGSLENKMLMLMARNWDNIKYLEISGEDITLDGIRCLRLCKCLETLRIRYATFGPETRPSEFFQADNIILQSASVANLSCLELTDTICDPHDFYVLMKLFPTLKKIDVFTTPDFGLLDEDGVSTMGEETFGAKSMAEVEFSCSKDPVLKRFVSFHRL